MSTPSNIRSVQSHVVPAHVGHSRTASGISGALRGIEQLPVSTLDVVDLSEQIEEAVERHRHRAFARGIRLTCCCLDDLPVAGHEREISARLDELLATAIRSAIPGSHAEFKIAAERGDVVVRLRFLRPVMRDAACSWVVGDGEVAARWPHVEA